MSPHAGNWLLVAVVRGDDLLAYDVEYLEGAVVGPCQDLAYILWKRNRSDEFVVGLKCRHLIFFGQIGNIEVAIVVAHCQQTRVIGRADGSKENLACLEFFGWLFGFGIVEFNVAEFPAGHDVLAHECEFPGTH